MDVHAASCRAQARFFVAQSARTNVWAKRHAGQEAGREAGEAGHGWQHRLARVPGSPAAVSRLPGAPRERFVSVSTRPSLRPCSWPCRRSTVPSASTSQPSTRAHANTSSLKWKSSSPPLKHGNEELPAARKERSPRSTSTRQRPSGGTNSTKRYFHECALKHFPRRLGTRTLPLPG